MNRLTPEQLVLLNKKITGDESGDLRVRFSELEEIAQIPYEQNERFFYKYKGVKEKAAELGSLIAKREPFEKANLETAVLALLTLLDINNYRLINYSQDIETLCIYLKEPETNNVRQWIKDHLPKEGVQHLFDT